jgi:hypothetical protein
MMFWVMTECSLGNVYSFRGTDSIHGSFKAFTVVLFRVSVLWDVMLRHLANGSRYFEGMLETIHLTHHHVPDPNTQCCLQFTLKMEVEHYSELPVDIYQTTQNCIPDTAVLVVTIINLKLSTDTNGCSNLL